MIQIIIWICLIKLKKIFSNKETMEKLNPETTEDQISKLKTLLDVMDRKTW